MLCLRATVCPRAIKRISFGPSNSSPLLMWRSKRITNGGLKTGRAPQSPPGKRLRGNQAPHPKDQDRTAGLRQDRVGISQRAHLQTLQNKLKAKGFKARSINGSSTVVCALCSGTPESMALSRSISLTATSSNRYRSRTVSRALTPISQKSGK